MPRKPRIPTRTAVDDLLDDPRLSQVLDAFATRVQAGRPVRWHRLIHTVLQCQMAAGPDLALVTEAK